MLRQNTSPDTYFGLAGRISRKVYWLHYVVPLLAVGFLVGIIEAATQAGAVMQGLISLVMLVPQLACSFMRLHDRNRSGWFLLVAMIPIVGWI